MDAKFHITRAKNSDRRQLIRYWEQLDLSLPENPFGASPSGKKKFYAQLARQLTKMDHGFALIGWHGKQAAGTICAHLYDKIESTYSPVGIIYNLWIDPQFRRQGLASQLATAAEEYLHEIGARSFQVAWRNDPTAEYFWNSRGYAAYETLGAKVAPKPVAP
ncbi:hypothetical protein GCM10025791_21660 [Halioxenophilus aromaticivorans]|uniref:N-acetyltransferase domain-containing protein n=1 Tax=Halioxenophilus aromaticivorans TaxID=1306992 RepID=A0AAV3U2T8_9ALTE